jgi:hypothetical protein
VLGQSPWQRRLARLKQRDEGFRMLAQTFYAGMSVRHAAQEIEKDIKRLRYRASGNLPIRIFNTKVDALERVIDLCGDKQLGWRRIAEVLSQSDGKSPI